MAGATVPTGANFQIRVWSVLAEQAAVTTHNFKLGVVTGLLDLQDVARSADAIIHTAYKGIMTSQATYRGIQAYLLNVLPLPVPQVETANAGAATGGAVAQSRQTCGITSWKTQFAGPGNRGRTYWPFPPTSGDESIGEPNEAYIDAVQTLNALLFASMVITGIDGSATAFLVLRVRRTPSAPIAIESFQTQQKWATQKRRGSYGRVNASPI